MTEKKEYRIRSCGTLVPVTQEVYQVFYQAKRRAKTLYEKDERNGLVSYDGMDTEDTLGEEMIPDRDAISVEDAAIAILHAENICSNLGRSQPTSACNGKGMFAG